MILLRMLRITLAVGCVCWCQQDDGQYQSLDGHCSECTDDV